MLKMTSESPGFSCRCLDVTTEVADSVGTVMMSVENQGFTSVGVTRGFTIFTYRQSKGGEWRCARNEGTHGGLGLEGNVW